MPYNGFRSYSYSIRLNFGLGRRLSYNIRINYSFSPRLNFNFSIRYSLEDLNRDKVFVIIIFFSR
jgi:hypothetical protein